MQPGRRLARDGRLDFFEEEILSPIQHLVRIFTLYGLGQCLGPQGAHLPPQKRPKYWPNISEMKYANLPYVPFLPDSHLPLRL